MIPGLRYQMTEDEAYDKFRQDEIDDARERRQLMQLNQKEETPCSYSETPA